MEGTSGAQLEFINKSIDLSGLDSETVEVLSDTWVPVSAVYTPTSDEKVLTIMARRKNVYSAKQFAQEGKNSLLTSDRFAQTSCFNLIKTLYTFI